MPQHCKQYSQSTHRGLCLLISTYRANYDHLVVYMRPTRRLVYQLRILDERCLGYSFPRSRCERIYSFMCGHRKKDRLGLTMYVRWLHYCIHFGIVEDTSYVVIDGTRAHGWRGSEYISITEKISSFYVVLFATYKLYLNHKPNSNNADAHMFLGPISYLQCFRCDPSSSASSGGAYTWWVASPLHVCRLVGRETKIVLKKNYVIE